MPSGRDETTQSSPPSDHDGNVQAGETEQARERVASASAARATASPSPPSLLQQWTDLLGSPQDWLLPPSCSGCLTQVVDDDNGNGDGAVESASQVDTTSSSLDRDETPARDSSSSRLNLSPDTDSTDANLSASYRSGKLKSASRSTTIPHPHCEDEGDELSTNQNCPICLNTMSRSDIIYPITCPTSCNYNFCVDCMSSLLRSSREDYQVASDGSRQVKIRLQCPNCRAGIADIIEDVISLRQEALAADIELSDKKMPASSTVPSTLSTSHGSKLKNRSSAPRHVHQLRINDLIEKIQSMPTPSSVRDQVLAVHGRRVERQGSFSSASLIDDTLSRCSSLSSVEVQTVQPLSSTISSPIYTRSSSLEPPGPPSRAHSLDLLASPQVNRLVTPSPIRRTKSFQTPPSSPQHEQKSPRSILDFTYSYNEDALEQKKKSGLTQAHSPRPHGERTEGSKVCLEGINFTEGEGGYFSNAIDLDWCCYDITSNDHTSSFQKEDPSTKIKGSEDCGGYVDYGGTYHPCSDVAQLDGRNQAIEWEGPCQGCIFRRGMHDGSESDEEEEELYYDSDPGQHFAIGGSWSKELPPASSCGNLDITGRESNRQLSASPPTTPQRAKSRWRRRRKRQGKKSRSRGSAASFTSSQASSHAKDACSAYLEVVQQRKEEEDLRQRHDDQQAHLYDYFSRNDDAVNSMRTGFYSTRETDVGSYVQEALNSKWRLQWHATAKSPRSSTETKTCEIWIERGFRRNRKEIVEPKLMWRELSQPNLHRKRQLGGSTIRPYRVSLFAIRRIFQVTNGAEGWEEMNAGSRHQPTQASFAPMVKQNCLLLVRSSLGEDYVFEASCPEERDHIVHLWKMVTARLVSHAVAGNGDLMIREFFNEETCVTTSKAS